MPNRALYVASCADLSRMCNDFMLICCEIYPGMHAYYLRAYPHLLLILSAVGNTKRT